MSHVFTVNNASQPAMTLDSNGSLHLGSNTTSRGGPFGATGQVITQTDRINMADLNSEVFNAKIDDLINLWVTRYGNEWVDLIDIEQDEFYLRVYKRLRQLGQLEQHYLTDRSRFVCRKPE